VRITRRGKPVAQITAVQRSRSLAGLAKARWMASDLPAPEHRALTDMMPVQRESVALVRAATTSDVSRLDKASITVLVP
jgi:antitoxin (DNA-binding transcriptional repressor) of toxin-antitoxin stability system